MPKASTQAVPYPLPADYYDLTAEGRRQARVWAVTNRTTPEQYVGAWDFFRNYHLNWEGANFYKEFKPSPPLHYELVSFFRRFRLNGIASPRNTAKSTVIGKECPLMELVAPSLPGMSIGLVLAKDQFVEDRFDSIMLQLTDNARIIDDFGALKPKKGEGVWNRHYLRLTNLTSMTGYSMDGRKRGGRPDLLIVDDPEFDPDIGSNVAAINANLQNELLRVLLGMMSPSSILFWIGTLLHRKSFLYKIVKGNDPRFRQWNRRIYEAESGQPDGSTAYLWKDRLTPEFLDSQRSVMGEGAYRAEYCNDPRSDAEPILSVDSVLSEYHLDNINEVAARPQETNDPLNSPTMIRWTDVTYNAEGAQQFTDQHGKFGEIVTGLRRYMTVDYAPAESANSDYSALVVWGIDNSNTLWVLDAWQGRVRASQLLRIIWEYGVKWACHLVGVEAVALQDEIRQQVSDFMAIMQSRGQWTPRVRGIRYANQVSKGDRIGSLEWRFTRGRIKFPSYLRSVGAMSVLRDQVAEFTPDLSRLEHDDLVDALAMAHSIIGTGSTPVQIPTTKRTTWAERIMGGEFHLAENPLINTMSAYSPDEWTPAMMEAIEKASHTGPLADRPTQYIERLNEYAPFLDPDDFHDLSPVEMLIGESL